MTTLAYSMLKWIRANKDELKRIRSTHPALPILSLLFFERRYRGAAHWLKNPGAASIPDGFNQTVKNQVRYLLETLRPHRKGFAEAGCTTLFDMPGLPENDYHEFYRQFLSANLNAVAKEKKELKISHNGKYGQLTLTISNGCAATTHQWDYASELPAQARGDLREQLDGLEKGWIAARESFRKFINDPENWPSDSARFRQEEARIGLITKRLLGSLGAEDLALLKKHQTMFRQCLNTYIG